MLRRWIIHPVQVSFASLWEPKCRQGPKGRVIVSYPRSCQLDPIRGARPRDIYNDNAVSSRDVQSCLTEVEHAQGVANSRIVVIGLDAFPEIPTTKIVKNLTFRVFYFVPFKYGRPYGLAEPWDVKHFPKSKRSGSRVNMRRNKLRDYGYAPREECKVNQIRLVSVSSLEGK